MQKQKLDLGTRTLSVINKKWDSAIEELPDFIGKCKKVKEWGATVFANMLLKQKEVSVICRVFDDSLSKDKEFLSRAKGKVGLQISTTIESNFSAEGENDLVVVWLIFSEDCTELESSILYNTLSNYAVYDGSLDRMIQELDQLLLVLPWLERNARAVKM